jgi:hypothetical protein
MITLADLTPRRVITSLRSDTCPSCGGHKGPGKSFWLKEYRKLPQPIRTALYDRVGEGYEDALIKAFDYLQTQTFHDPKPNRPPGPPDPPIPPCLNCGHQASDHCGITHRVGVCEVAGCACQQYQSGVA